MIDSATANVYAAGSAVDRSDDVIFRPADIIFRPADAVETLDGEVGALDGVGHVVETQCFVVIGRVVAVAVWLVVADRQPSTLLV